MELSASASDELKQLVSDYLSRLVCTFDDEDRAFCQLDSWPLLKYEIAEKPEADDLEEAIAIAVASRERDGKLVAPDVNDRRNKGRCKSHQCRIPIGSYSELTKQLTSVSHCIEAAGKFDEIHKIVDKEAQHIHGVGALMTYDVALRIALWRGKNYHPEHVYLHATPLKSAKLLIHPSVKGKLKTTDFPESFQELSCLNIENFLCVYHDKIKRVVAGNSGLET